MRIMIRNARFRFIEEQLPKLKHNMERSLRADRMQNDGMLAFRLGKRARALKLAMEKLK